MKFSNNLMIKSAFQHTNLSVEGKRRTTYNTHDVRRTPLLRHVQHVAIRAESARDDQGGLFYKPANETLGVRS